MAGTYTWRLLQLERFGLFINRRQFAMGSQVFGSDLRKKRETNDSMGLPVIAASVGCGFQIEINGDSLAAGID